MNEENYNDEEILSKEMAIKEAEESSAQFTNFGKIYAAEPTYENASIFNGIAVYVIAVASVINPALVGKPLKLKEEK